MNGNDTADDPDHPGKRRGQKRQNQCMDKCGSHEGRNRLAQRITGAEITAQGTADITEKLHKNRLVEPEFRGHPLNDRIVSVLAHQNGNRIAGYDSQHDKDQQRAPEQDKN